MAIRGIAKWKKEVSKIEASLTRKEIMESEQFAEISQAAVDAMTVNCSSRVDNINVYRPNDKSLTAYSEGGRIVVNTGMESIEKESVHKKAMLLVAGLRAHECGHELFTDATMWNKYFNELLLSPEKILTDENSLWKIDDSDKKIAEKFINTVIKAKNRKKYVQFAHQIYNAYEDAYVNNGIFQFFSGEPKIALKTLNDNVFGNNEPLEIQILKVKIGLCDITSLFINYLHLESIGYPYKENGSELNEEDQKIKEILLKYLEDVKEPREKLPLVTNTKERMRLVTKVILKAYELMRDSSVPEPPQTPEKKSDKTSDEDSSNTKSESKSGSSGSSGTKNENSDEESDDESNEDSENENSDEESDDESNSDESNEDSENENSDEESDDESNEDSENENSDDESDDESNSDESDEDSDSEKISKDSKSKSSEKDLSSSKCSSDSENVDNESDDNDISDDELEEIANKIAQELEALNNSTEEKHAGRALMDGLDKIDELNKESIEKIKDILEKNKEKELQGAENKQQENIDDLAEDIAERNKEKEHTEQLQKEAHEINDEIIRNNDANRRITVKLVRPTYISDTERHLVKNVCNKIKNPVYFLTRKLETILKDREVEEFERRKCSGTRVFTKDAAKPGMQVFARRNEPTGKPNIRICVLIDESGSMNAKFGSSNRSSGAREKAIMMHQVLTNLNVSHCVIGHTTFDYDELTLYNYVDFDTVDKNDIYRLGTTDARSGNMDGAAITQCCEKLMKYPEKKVLIIISDGEPTEPGYFSDDALKDTKIAVETYTKKGVEIIAAKLTDRENSIYKMIYGNKTLDCSTPEKFSNELTKLIQKYVLSN